MKHEDELSEAFRKCAEQCRTKAVKQPPSPPPDFVCTKCRTIFEGVDHLHATCPRCGDNYSNFFTSLIRCGTLALAYWIDGNPGIEFDEIGRSGNES